MQNWQKQVQQKRSPNIKKAEGAGSENIPSARVVQELRVPDTFQGPKHEVCPSHTTVLDKEGSKRLCLAGKSKLHRRQPTT